MFEPVRGGTRGGQAEFKWSDVSQDKDREHYLGHSVNAPTGRWQKNKDVHWYNRDLAATEAERLEEIRKVKELESEALGAALGYDPVQPKAEGDTPASSANQIPLPVDPEKLAKEKAAKEERKRQKAERKEEKRRRKEEKKLSRHKHHHHRDDDSDRDSDEYERRRHRHRSRSRSPPRRPTSPSSRLRPLSPINDRYKREDSGHSRRRSPDQYHRRSRSREQRPLRDYSR